MKSVFLFVIFSLLGTIIGGGIFILTHKLTDPKKFETIKDPPFTVELPPKKSEKGMIQSMKGIVKWEFRIATEGAIISGPVEIAQAEKLETGENGSVTVHFEKGLDVALFSSTQIEFAQTLPQNFVFNQLRGKIQYQKNSSVLLAVRTRRLLTTINNGEATIVLDDATGNVSITVKKGSARVAFNNAENVSTVIDISEGEEFEFNHEAREGAIL